MTTTTLIKESIELFRVSVHDHHDGEHGGLQANVMLELRADILKATGS